MKNNSAVSGKARNHTQEKLLVLAGGFGTRLRTVVGDRPKPLADVHGKPFLDLLIQNWVGQGIRDFVFLLHHQSEQIGSHLNEIEGNELNGCQYVAVTEPTPMGTGGAVAYAVRKLRLRDPFLVANADTWLDTGILELSLCKAPAIAMVKMADSRRYGSLVVDENGCVSDFLEKSHDAASGWINAGLYHLDPQDFWSWNGAAFSMEQDLFPEFVAHGRLKAVPVDSEFIDIGVPDDYRRFLNWRKPQ